MADSTVTYQPRNYRRLCDVCGLLRNISDMHRQDDLWVCTYDAGERVRTELDRLNARERPFSIKPVPHPKPQNPYYPNTLETDDAAVFNFLSQQVENQCRYELVESGSAPWVDGGGTIAAMGWSARYFYDLIQAADRRADLIARAKVLLGQIADYLLTRQRGFGLSSSSTRANDLFYGGLLASGASNYVTQDASTSGLALLYAYRVLGTLSYRDGARAAASYLRNVQAIGSHGAQFTSTSANGTGRLYTGAVCSEVSTRFGVDPGQFFYSNHLFYLSDIIALEFWNELKLTDGDQSIGCTATLNGFDSTPAQLLSASITDMRSCWETGITETTGELVNGLSSTTPREYFNAYPQVKAGFTVIGTGMWEYVDGGANTGTKVSSQGFAGALSALYNYEGATSQVTTISDWLRSFSSNPDFETPDDISTAELYRGTTGTYDPTLAPASLLMVRDPDNDYAAVALNGSSLYDWGAFGLLSRIWASRNRASFMTSRLYPLNTVQRYFDGTANDGLATDRVELRGLSGLTMQTGFFSNTLGSTPGGVAYTEGGSSITTPPTTGLVAWYKGDVGVTVSAGEAIAWADQSGYGQDLDQHGVSAAFYGVYSIDDVPCVSFPLGFGNSSFLARTQNLLDRNGNPIQSGARTVMAMFIPINASGFAISGGAVVAFFQEAPAVACLFDLESNVDANGAYAFAKRWRGDIATANQFTPVTGGSSGPYNLRPTLASWRLGTFSGGTFPLTFYLDNQDTPVTPSLLTVSTPVSETGFVVGCGSTALETCFNGAIAELLIWDYELGSDENSQAVSYLATRYSSLPQENRAMVNDAVRAAQFGRSYREARG